MVYQFGDGTQNKLVKDAIKGDIIVVRQLRQKVGSF